MRRCEQRRVGCHADLDRDRGPADHVESQDCALQPGFVGSEVVGRDVFESGATIQIADHRLDHSVMAVELVDLCGVNVEVGVNNTRRRHRDERARPQREVASRSACQ